MEAGRFDLAWGGIAGLSVALPVIYTECLQAWIWAGRDCSVDELLLRRRWLGLERKAGALEAGRDANFVVFDTEAELHGDAGAGCTFATRFRPILARRCEGW